MTHVLGLDTGLAHTGAALLHDTGHIDTLVLHTDPAHGLTATDARLSRIARWTTSLTSTATALAVIEGPAYATDHGQSDERSGLRWRVYRGLIHRNIPIAVCPPTTLKKWVTGDGHASKDDVRAAVAALWPGRGLTRVSTHQAEAVALASVGAQCWLQWPGPWLGPSPTALATITWPDNTHPPGATP